MKNPALGTIVSLRGIRDAMPECWQKALGPVVRVPVRSLIAENTLRASGESAEHIRVLAAASAEPPPIVVHRATMRVVDGLHRLRAAELCKRESIAARMFDGEEADALVFAVQANLTTTLPLSLADRKAAAERIVGLYPQWSDGLVASITNLSPKTVRGVRRGRPAESTPSTEGRVGRDGRVRPVNAAEKRREASDLFRKNPEMPLRQVAKAVGISPETARSVRNRLLRGEEPDGRERDRSTWTAERAREADRQDDPPVVVLKGPVHAAPQRAAAIRQLMADPALRYSENGRFMLRLLKAHAMSDEEWTAVIKGLPVHARQALSSVSLEYAKGWVKIARKLARNAPLSVQQ